MGVPNAAQTPAVTAVATSTTTATIVAAGSKRTRVIFNDSAGILYVLLGTGVAASTLCSYKLAAGTTVTVDRFGGPIQGVLDAGTGFARVTEW